MALASGTRRVYNRFYRNKATVESYAPTPSQIEEYFASQGFDANSLTDEQFNQAVNHFSKGGLSTVDSESVSKMAEQNVAVQSNEIVISSADKQALVNTQSSALGFSLTEEETAEIANGIDDVFDDYSSFINSVTSAIKSYIAHKFDTIEDNLENSTAEVREYITARTNQLNKKVSGFADHVKAIQTDTTEIRTSLKKSQAAVLSRFRFS